MPKAKPTQVIVHRIELQEKEREALEAMVVGNTIKNVFVPTAVVVGVGSATYIGYKAAKSFFNWTEDIPDLIQDLIHTDVSIGKKPIPAVEAIVGKKEYTDPETGQTYKNPLAGVPILGSLFGSGINIGIATNPFKS
jgi:hypothetical protein